MARLGRAARRARGLARRQPPGPAGAAVRPGANRRHPAAAELPARVRRMAAAAGRLHAAAPGARCRLGPGGARPRRANRHRGACRRGAGGRHKRRSACARQRRGARAAGLHFGYDRRPQGGGAHPGQPAGQHAHRRQRAGDPQRRHGAHGAADVPRRRAVHPDAAGPVRRCARAAASALPPGRGAGGDRARAPHAHAAGSGDDEGLDRASAVAGPTWPACAPCGPARACCRPP